MPRRTRPADFIEKLARPLRDQGYREIPTESHAELIVQFATDGWGGPKDLEFRGQVEELLNETLGWTGNGHCDGGDIGSGTINTFSFVVVADAAVEAVRAALAEREGSIAP